MKNLLKKILMLLSAVMVLCSCQKWVEIEPKKSALTSESILSTDQNANAAMLDLFANLSQQNGEDILQFGLAGSQSLFLGISADEFMLFDVNANTEWNSITTNGLLPTDVPVQRGWEDAYKRIFTCNFIIDGLKNNNQVSEQLKSQLEGEALFLRAFYYLFLVNHFGDVPLQLSSDHKNNLMLPRVEKIKVYSQIVADLIESKQLLKADYVGANGKGSSSEKIRPIKYAASALIARVYCYMGREGNSTAWASAEVASTEVITASQYSLPSLSAVFQKNSKETIWALQPVGANENVNSGEGKTYVLNDFFDGTNRNIVYLSDGQTAAFSSVDGRKSEWVSSCDIGGVPRPFCNKYKAGVGAPPLQEYAILLRLAEQYLIRAEARAEQGKLTGSGSAKEDLDKIRTRAGLTGTTATDLPEMRTAILNERRLELFGECGHRWIDLKTMGKLDDVMKVATAEKGGTWASYKALFPIPQSELNANPNIKGHQNPGYPQ